MRKSGNKLERVGIMRDNGNKLERVVIEREGEINESEWE